MQRLPLPTHQCIEGIRHVFGKYVVRHHDLREVLVAPDILSLIPPTACSSSFNLRGVRLPRPPLLGGLASDSRGERHSPLWRPSQPALAAAEEVPSWRSDPAGRRSKRAGSVRKRAARKRKCA